MKTVHAASTQLANWICIMHEIELMAQKKRTKLQKNYLNAYCPAYLCACISVSLPAFLPACQFTVEMVLKLDFR